MTELDRRSVLVGACGTCAVLMTGGAALSGVCAVLSGVCVVLVTTGAVLSRVCVTLAATCAVLSVGGGAWS